MKKQTLLSIILLITLNSFSSQTSFFTLSRAEAFNQGERLNVTITGEGKLELSGDLKEIYSSTSLLVNDVKYDKNGNLYIATGNRGIIYKKTKDGKVNDFFSPTAFSITSIEITDKGIFASVLPDSEIWFIDFEGKAKKIAKFDERYLWKISAHHSGDLYVACGSTAALYKIDATGKKELIFKSDEDNHFQALVIHKDLVIFASEGKGAVYEYNTKTKKIRVLYETYEKEITALAVNEEGEVFFATGTVKKLKLPSGNFDYTDTFIRMAQGTQRFAENATYIKNSVYMYDKNGNVKKLFTKDNFLFLSLAIIDKENLYVGTGNLGIIFKITKDGRAFYSYRIQENQVITMNKINNTEILIGTGNPGRVYTISNNLSNKGTYTSTIYDANAISNWGKISLDATIPAQTSITFETRTGNTSRVDTTWSNWQKTSTNNKILSPKARYIQFKVNLATLNITVTPSIRNIEIPYFRENRAPEITTFEFKKGVAKKQTGETDYNICNLSWNAFDADNDPLWYKIFAKKEDHTDWIVVLRNTRNLNIMFDSRMFPDGIYYFKIIASDSLDNPIDKALTAERISDPILIDNSSPEITKFTINKNQNDWELDIIATDEFSIISKAQVSINYSEAVSISPEDGIFDDKTETFKYKITKKRHKELKKGENVVIIRITDNSGNIATKSKIINY